MSAKETPEYIQSALKFGINLGLDRMNRLDELLGNPEKDIRAIHIAGTNGKGSVSAFITSILASAGYKVGVYTSPFLERFSERMRVIDGREGLLKFIEDETYGEIEDDDLARLSEQVEKASEQMIAEGAEHPTEFELVTAICYLWFKEQNADIVVLETGLGGRLDSTNVIESPLCSVITAIGFDHCDRLGNTIEEISFEKAGIIKEGCPVIVSDPDEMIIDPQNAAKVREVFTRIAEERNAPLSFAKAGNKEVTFTSDAKMRFSIEGDDNIYETRLLGEHQIKNAAAAISACRLVEGVTEEDIVYGVSHTVWKGRAECMSLDPVVVIDGGHNDQGAKSLAGVLSKMLGGKLAGKPFRAVVGVMKDKDIDGMLAAWKNGNVVLDEVYAVRVSNPRTMEPHELGEKIELLYNKKVNVRCFEDAKTAVREAYERSVSDGMPLLVTGSLYLLGEVRGVLKECTTTNSSH